MERIPTTAIKAATVSEEKPITYREQYKEHRIRLKPLNWALIIKSNHIISYN